jgi:phage shock protein A
MTDAALPFFVWCEEIQSELALAQTALAAALAVLREAETVYNAAKAEHEALRSAIADVRQPLASVLATRVLHSDENVRDLNAAVGRARGAVAGLRARTADLEEGLAQLRPLCAPADKDQELVE